jgi:origin recognition complex subunit 2
MVQNKQFRLVFTVEDPFWTLMVSPRTIEALAFISHDVSTFMCYSAAELDSVPDVVTGGTHNKRSIKGALFVLQSLTPQARAIFKILADWQLCKSSQNHSNQMAVEDEDEGDGSEGEDETVIGLSFLELFKMAQSKFLVSSEPSFRVMMTEFMDHELMRQSRDSISGSSVLFIPFSASSIREILSMMSSMQ